MIEKRREAMSKYNAIHDIFLTLKKGGNLKFVEKFRVEIIKVH